MNRIVYSFFIFLVGMQISAQSDFEVRIIEIKEDIKIITEMEKETLRLEVEEINARLEKKEITSVEAELQKKAKAEACADRIQSRVEPLEREIQRLVKEEVEGDSDDDNIDIDMEEDEDANDNDNDEMEDIGEELEEEMRELKGDLGRLSKKWKPGRKKYKSEERTTSQFIFAFGLNNVISDGDFGSLDNNGIRVSNSRFYEWGWTWKTRLAQNSPLLQLKYGLSMTYNNLRPENNQYYVKSGQQTLLAEHPQALIDEPYFRTTNLVIPVHLEFDFTKKRVYDETVVVKSQKSVRMGIGGYAGINVRTKQLLEYKEDGLRTELKTRGDFNTSNIIYGLSAYIGYRDMSIYTKYDLNTLFSDNPVEQNNVSLGIRFDFN